MANINNYGYEKLRTFIMANWKYLELQTEAGTPLKRFSESDGLVITGTPSGASIEYKITVRGSDAPFTGQSVGKSVLFDTATGGSAIATESFTAFTFEQEEDELTIRHILEVPKVM